MCHSRRTAEKEEKMKSKFVINKVKGTLHRLPSGECCNVDQIERKNRLYKTTFGGIAKRALPPNMRTLLSERGLNDVETNSLFSALCLAAD
jgi:hypothetical protein